MKICRYWRSYRKNKCFYFDLDEISRVLPKQILKLYNLRKGDMSIEVGYPVIVYKRFNGRPHKDQLFCGIVTEVKRNIRKERTVYRIFRCPVYLISEEEYNDIIKHKKGNLYRSNFVLPYDEELYIRMLNWYWQMKYFLTGKIYEFFPFDFSKPSNIIEQLRNVDPKQFEEEAKLVVGFDFKKEVDRNIVYYGSKPLDYRQLVNKLKQKNNENK